MLTRACSVLVAVNRRGDLPAARDKLCRGRMLYRHDRRFAQQSAEFHVLLLIIPIAASSAIMAEMVDALVSPGMATISIPTLHTAVIASSLLKVSSPQRAASIMP